MGMLLNVYEGKTPLWYSFSRSPPSASLPSQRLFPAAPVLAASGQPAEAGSGRRSLLQPEEIQKSLEPSPLRPTPRVWAGRCAPDTAPTALSPADLHANPARTISFSLKRSTNHPNAKHRACSFTTSVSPRGGTASCSQHKNQPTEHRGASQCLGSFLAGHGSRPKHLPRGALGRTWREQFL